MHAKYGNKSFLPELRVIDSGMLRGFVVINPRWAGFKEKEYYMACQSTYTADEADIFANQMKYVKSLLPYEVFKANLEAGNDDQIIINDLVESYGLAIGTKKCPGMICAISTIESILCQ